MTSIKKRRAKRQMARRSIGKPGRAFRALCVQYGLSELEAHTRLRSDPRRYAVAGDAVLVAFRLHEVVMNDCATVLRNRVIIEEIDRAGRPKVGGRFDFERALDRHLAKTDPSARGRMVSDLFAEAGRQVYDRLFRVAPSSSEVI